MKQAQAVSASGPDPDRMRHIDLTRGLLIYWMVTAHAITLAGIRPDNWLFYLRPPGWATHGFIMLSGFSMAVALIGRSFNAKALHSRLWRRGVQLLAYALGSDLLSRCLTDFVFRSSQPQFQGSLFDLSRPWTISAFLVPTGLMFLFCSLLCLYLKVPQKNILVYTCLAALALDNLLISAIRPVQSWLMAPGTLGISIFYFLALGFMGLCLGLLSKHMSPRIFSFGALIAGSSLLLLTHFAKENQLALHTGTFLFTIAAVALVDSLPISRFLGDHLAILGRSALLVFIMHRLILQVLRCAIPDNLTGSLLLFALLTSSLLLLFLMCRFKERTPHLARSLRFVGL
jgi:hypothetical protein